MRFYHLLLIGLFTGLPFASGRAETVDLKCQLVLEKTNKESETWISIDAASNYMRVEGVASPLVMTNDKYVSSKKGGVMSIVTTIDRGTGNITQSAVFDGEVSPYSRGTCERARPPQMKF